MQNQHSQAGLSLIEALIAIVILSIGLIGATKLQLSINMATQTSRQRVEAMNYARNKVELLRDAGACTAATEGPTTPYQGSTAYNLTVTCTTVKQPVVTVTWVDSKGDNSNLVIQTNI
ncbi:type IV pilus modification protein PilV [Vogesella facilis]|uniref:Type IV pilus modification protein PilV n=1 Tax=Vogesella facilis TaxID=1655232 RepID=A0ABV7RM20_9NEIS